MTAATSRRSLVLATMGLLASALQGAPQPAHAQAAYPSRPIRLIVTFVPGGGADVLARYLAQELTTALGQTVIVENKPGAGGMLGTEAGLAAAPDGHTLTLISSSYTVNPSLYKLKFDPVAGITPIVQVSKGPLLAVVNPALPVRTLGDFTALAKSKPGQLTHASSGQGSVLHLATALYADRAGISLNHVPYKGGGAALNDVLANQIDLYFAATASALPLVKAGKLRPLAVTGAQRIAALPDVPTLAESGFKGYDVTLWYGLIGPKGLPPHVVTRLNTEVNKVLGQKEAAAKLEADGAVPAGGSAAQFQSAIASEVDLWRKIVTKLGVKLE